MKIFVDEKCVLDLNDTKLKVFCDEITEDILREDLERRLRWVLTHKYEGCFKRLKEQWESALMKAGHKMIPTDPDEFAELVFSLPDYKSAKQRREAGSPNNITWDNQADEADSK